MSQTTSKTTSRIPISSSTWFITGTGRGLGRNIAEEVLRRGGRVAGTVRNLARMDELKKQFPDQLWIGKLDLSDLVNIGSTFRAAVQHFGRVHAVVSTTHRPGAPESMTRHWAMSLLRRSRCSGGPSV